MSRCIIKNCKHYVGKKGSENVKFFNLPNHPKLLKKWINASGVDSILNIENARICSEHFAERDYSLEQILFNISNKKQLEKDTLPTQNFTCKNEIYDGCNKDNSKNKNLFAEGTISFKHQVMEWEKWCRLCGNENGNNVNIFIKEENSYSVVDMIHNFFAIEVNNFDCVPKNVCFVCNEFMKSLQYFSVKVKKVEKMFLEIDLNYKTGYKIDLQQIRSKYSLGNINSLHVKNDIKGGLINNHFNKGSIEYEECKIDTLTNNNFATKNDCDLGSPYDNENNVISITHHTNNISNISTESNLGKLLKKESLFNEYEDINNSKQLSEIEKKIKKRERNYNKNNQENKKFECEKCHVKFVRESNYAHHLKKNHNVIRPILPCNICGKMCKTKQKLKFHMELHLPAEEREKLLFKCTECDQKFTQKGAMRSHIRAKHSFEKPFICEQCGKKFSSQTNLWSHRRSHDDQNHLTCPKCPKIFKNKFRLKVHMRGHNDSGNPCSVCGLVLKTMNTLKNHMLVHSDTKAFECNYCGKGFKRDKNLLTHMITHSGLRPFVCRFCGQGYANRSNCKKHEKHSHSKDYEAAASVISLEPQQKVVKKLPNIQQLEAMLDQIKSEKQKGIITDL